MDRRNIDVHFRVGRLFSGVIWDSRVTLREDE